MIVDRASLVFKLAEVEDAVVAFDGPAGDAAKRGRAARLVDINVTTGLAQQLVARLSVRFHANLIGHSA